MASKRTFLSRMGILSRLTKSRPGTLTVYADGALSIPNTKASSGTTLMDAW
jgi:hypothetical protein